MDVPIAIYAKVPALLFLALVLTSLPQSRSAPFPPSSDHWLIALNSPGFTLAEDVPGNDPVSKIHGLIHRDRMKGKVGIVNTESSSSIQLQEIRIGDLHIVVAPAGSDTLKANLKQVEGVDRIEVPQIYKISEVQSNPPFGLGNEFFKRTLRVSQRSTMVTHSTMHSLTLCCTFYRSN
jgi:hypothetical protein